MSDIKWVTISVIIGVLWCDVIVIWGAFVDPLIGVPIATLSIPISIYIIKEIISDWKNS